MLFGPIPSATMRKARSIHRARDRLAAGLQPGWPSRFRQSISERPDQEGDPDVSVADVAIVRQNGCCGFLVDGVVYRCNADTLHESKPSWQQLANRTSGQDFSRIHVLANAAITAASRIAGVSNMSHLMSF